MWPFKKKKKKDQPDVKKDVVIPKAPVFPGAPGLPVTPTVPAEPQVSDKPEEEIKPKVSDKPEEEIKPIEPIDLESMTVVELKALAKERNLEGYSTLRKAELIDLLK